MRSFFYHLDKTASYARESNNLELYRLCSDIRNFICEGTFTQYKKAKLLMSYWGESDSYVSEHTGMKASTVRVTRRELSNTLYEKLGYDFFNVIGIGDKKAIQEGRYRLSILERGITSDDYFYREFKDVILKGNLDADDVDITTCASEIRFLYNYSKNKIMQEMSFLDKRKLAYLLRILDGEVGTTANLFNLIRTLDKEEGY